MTDNTITTWRPLNLTNNATTGYVNSLYNADSTAYTYTTTGAGTSTTGYTITTTTESEFGDIDDIE